MFVKIYFNGFKPIGTFLGAGAGAEAGEKNTRSRS